MCSEDPITSVFIALPALIGGQLTGRNPACPPTSPPAPTRPLCSVLNVWVTRMLPSNVHVQGRACVHSVTVCMCVCVCVSACKRKSGCVWVWRGSVDRNSWKQTCLARNSGMAHNNKFLKMSCDWSRPMAEEGFFGRESRPFFFEEVGLLTAVGRQSLLNHRLSHHSVLSVKCHS